ncbi:helix-turn-helix domain-containing protein [Erysipelotrichaceae bacterium OttesenSCG-928-M19]|nr:helix-turn-helix domain-containing protein [Erysipelotrichaceae bacterium OttesenSCG-928-M19]
MNSVGNLLKEQRLAQGMSIDEVVKATKVQKIYIEAIENGDFSFFKNQEFYQQVFVGSYADLLKLNKNDVLNDLQADIKDFIENPVEVKEKPIKTQMDPNIVKKYLQDYDVKPIQKDPVGEVSQVNTEIIEEQLQPEIENEEINQLIDEINKNVEVDLNEYFEEATPIDTNNLGNEEETIPDEILANQMLDDLISAKEDDTSLVNDDVAMTNLNDAINPVEVNETNMQPSFTESFLESPEREDVVQPSFTESFLQSPTFQEVEEQLEPENNTELKAEEDPNLLNNSLLDDIQKINDDVEATKDDISELDTVAEHPTNNFFNENRDSILDSTAVIDLTNGIEIETVSNASEASLPINEETLPVNDNIMTDAQMPVEPSENIEKVVEIDKVIETNPVEARPEFTIEEVSQSNDQILNELEKNLDSEQDLQAITQDLTKTSMDLKIAKALGDSKIEIDEKDAKKIKKDKIVDYALFIFIILLLIYLGYFVWSNFM